MARTRQLVCRARPIQSTTSIHWSGQPMTTAVVATVVNESTKPLTLFFFPTQCCVALISSTFDVVTVVSLLWILSFQVGRTTVYCSTLANHVKLFTRVSIFGLNKKKNNLSLWMAILGAGHSKVWPGNCWRLNGLERPSGVHYTLLRLSGLSLCDKHKWWGLKVLVQ